MEYQGVDTEHPRIVEAIKTLAKQNKQVYEIAKLVGMPYEVIEKYVRQEGKKK